MNGFKSIDKKINKNNKLFKCPFIGCKKIIAFVNSFINHKKQYLLINSDKAKNSQSIHSNESRDKANEKKSQNNFSSDPNYKAAVSIRRPAGQIRPDQRSFLARKDFERINFKVFCS
jgi:hypothetical protein